LLVYSKKPNFNPNKLPRTEEMNATYRNPDNDYMPWASDNPFAPGAATHQGMVYAIQHPFTGEMIYPSNSACWRYQQSDMLEIMRGWCEYELRELDDAEIRANVCGIPTEAVRKGVQAIVLSQSLEVSAKNAEAVLTRGQWPRFYFTRNGRGGIRRKTYLENVGGRVPTNLWSYSEVGHTDEAKKQMLAIFDGRATFDTPKPARLLERVLLIAGDENTIILDSFAGSGTTAHAVLNMNKADGGNRKFILIEMMDYADSITAERVKRVIDGYGEGRNAVDGTGGDFTFYDLGDALLLPDDNINESVGTDKLREYIWYMETHEAIQDGTAEEPYYLGTCNATAYYFCYEKDSVTTLDAALLSTIHQRAESFVIYADQCVFSTAELEKYHIVFRKIPRDIAKL